MKIDWERVKSIMLRSFRGEKIYDDESDLCLKAFNEDRPKYKVLNDEVRKNEMRRIMNGEAK